MNEITSGGQAEIIWKVALCAVLAGIVGGLVTGAMGGILIAGVVGMGSFYYFVSNYPNSGGEDLTFRNWFQRY